MKEYDVIIIGGGVTGAGVARDCAMRGLSTLLLERGDIADGASGRNHGLLHSGARYAVNDPEGARECIVENRILRHIASGCVEQTEGLFITLPEDSLEYQAQFVGKCRAAGIDAKAIDPKEALRMEPSVNPSLIGAVVVPDASVDPFRLVSANILDARLHGAEILTRHSVEGFIKEGVTIMGVKARDLSTGELKQFRAHYTINAAGIWGAGIAAMAGVRIGMLPAKGSLLVFGHRVNNMVINRCRKPSNADILVPGDVVCVIGTTSDKVPFEECDNMKVTPEEVKLLLEEGSKLAPGLASTRILRAYAGVRPLVADDSDPSGRSVSRGIVLLDHAKRDGIYGLVSITGGKLTTYRLMAEMTTDLICEKMSKNVRCTTALEPLPGSKGVRPSGQGLGSLAAFHRHGEDESKMEKDSEVLCECENVTRAEIAYAVRELGVKDMNDLRRRTRIGMGTCQGGFCMKKVAAALSEELGDGSKAEDFEMQYARERWKGMRPVMWGETLREAEYMRKMHAKK